MYIKKISWDEIYPIWKDYLWKNRKTAIKPTNGMLLSGEYDKDVEMNNPTFFGAFSNEELIGVNSGFATSDKEYRSRGIYVSKMWRKKGVAQLLFEAVEDQAIKEGKKILWSIPRESALSAYQNFGFEVLSQCTADMEFGPNYYVMKRL